jgi:HD-like signal output (HDOD) protein
MAQATTTKLDLIKVLAAAQLPALPQSAIRLLELSQDPQNGPVEFSVPIEADPGLTGQILKFVNSSYFGFAREISSIKMAITLVGIRTIKNFALWSAVFSLMPNPRCGPFDLKALWQDSFRRALFARLLAKWLGLKESEEIFSAALLQDMAVPILAKEAPGVYIKLLELRNSTHVRLSSIEFKLFQWTHAQAAGMMARHWNLPEDFADLIESHLDIEKYIECPREEPAKLAVAMSALLPTIADPVWNECELFESYYEKIVPNGPTVTEVLAQIDAEFAEFAPVMKLTTPSKSLVDCFHEVTAPSA